MMLEKKKTIMPKEIAKYFLFLGTASTILLSWVFYLRAIKFK